MNSALINLISLHTYGSLNNMIVILDTNLSHPISRLKSSVIFQAVTMAVNTASTGLFATEYCNRAIISDSYQS